MRRAEPVLSKSERVRFAAVLAILAVIMVLMSCTSCMPPRALSGDVPSQVDVPVALLVQVVDGEETGACTVFKVAGNDLAMTAGHCCGADDAQPTDRIVDELLREILGGEAAPREPRKPPTVTYHAKGPHAVPGAAFEILVDDDEHDVCLLRGKLRGPSLHLAAFDPPIGARVWTAGYPRGQFLISDGLWSGRDASGEAVASTVVWGGASGSPVLDQQGRVVGILRAYYKPLDSLSVIAPVEWVRNAYLRGR